MAETTLLDVNLLQELQKDNPWWKNNKIPEDWDKPFYRSDFYKYITQLDSKDIQVIIGPRRVGKTILLYQLMKYLMITQKIEGKNIIYLDLSKPYIAFNIGGILPCLKVYQENILKRDFADLKKEERIYIFVDEIQKEKDWAVNLESLRSRRLPITFFVTGSSGTEIDKKASESLVGRANFRYIMPLKFKDIVRKELGYNETKLEEIKELCDVFEKAVKTKDVKLLYDYILKELITTTLTSTFQIKSKDILGHYLLKGGYPEFYEEYREEHWNVMSKRMRDDYFERIISRDIVEAFNVNKPEIIRKLYLLIAFDTSNVANFANYARIIDTRKNTIVDYFAYLHRSFLITSSEKYYLKHRPRGEQKKVYVVDVGMRNAVLGVTKHDLGSHKAQLGQLAETIVHGHCMRLKYRIHPTNNFILNYWRAKNQKEIDIVMDLGDTLLPIEVKYTESINSEDKNNLKQYLIEHKKKAGFGILVTKDEIFLDNNIIGIPLWLFLLIC